MIRPILAAIVALGVGAVLAALASCYGPRDFEERAAAHLGIGSVCASTNRAGRVECVREHRRWLCLVVIENGRGGGSVECAPMTPELVPPAEAP